MKTFKTWLGYTGKFVLLMALFIGIPAAAFGSIYLTVYLVSAAWHSGSK